MKSYFKSGAERTYDYVRQRLGRVPPAQRLTWADSGVWALQAALDEYRRENTTAALQEARKAAVSLLAAVDSLLDIKD